jgi:hypothetical protein
MPEKLDPSDFRASRWKLLPDDFALGPEGPDAPPRDLIDEETWDSIIHLPDDVSIRTSNTFGSEIRASNRLCADWVSFTLDLFGSGDKQQSPLGSAVKNSFSELQASLYNAIVGYYRTGISAMRNVLEHLTIGLDFELSGNTTQFNDWLNGNDDDTIKFGNSATRLTNDRSVRDFEARILAATGDNVFRQKDRPSNDPGGFARRLFADLSKYAHGAPGHTEADLWQSNGPVFCAKVFIKWCALFGKVMALAVLMITLGVSGSNPHVSRAKELFKQACSLIPQGEDGESLLQAIAEDAIWRTDGC